MLRARIAKLSTASLRISASLDLDTVLSEVVESARALTGARYGGIVTGGDPGQPFSFVSSGFTADEHRQLLDWGNGPRLCETIRDLEGTLTLKDLHGYVRSLGFAPHPVVPKTVQATAMRHRGEHVGNFFVAGKEGGRGFTGEDESEWRRPAYGPDRPAAGASPRAGRPGSYRPGAQQPLHLRLWKGRDDCHGSAIGGRRLHRQALLGDRAGGESAGSSAQAGRAPRTLTVRRVGYRMARPSDL